MEKVKILTSASIFADVGTKITVMENILHLSVNASVCRDIRTRGMLEDAAATRRTSRQTDVFVSMFVCSCDARS